MKTALGDPGPTANHGRQRPSPTTCSTSSPATSSTSRRRARSTRAQGPGDRREGPRQRLHDRPAPAGSTRSRSRPRWPPISAGKATSGTTGSRSLQTTVKPGNVTLDPNTPATISGGRAPELDVQVSNQGSVDEKRRRRQLQPHGRYRRRSAAARPSARSPPGSIQTRRRFRSSRRPEEHAADPRGHRRIRCRASRSPTTTASRTRSPSARWAGRGVSPEGLEVPCAVAGAPPVPTQPRPSAP